MKDKDLFQFDPDQFLPSLAEAVQAEYEAVVGQLALSAGHFRMGHSSRNYIDYVRQTFGRAR